jgi:hypothetical protein
MWIGRGCERVDVRAVDVIPGCMYHYYHEAARTLEEQQKALQAELQVRDDLTLTLLTLITLIILLSLLRAVPATRSSVAADDLLFLLLVLRLTLCIMTYEARRSITATCMQNVSPNAQAQRKLTEDKASHTKH